MSKWTNSFIVEFAVKRAVCLPIQWTDLSCKCNWGEFSSQKITKFCLQTVNISISIIIIIIIIIIYIYIMVWFHVGIPKFGRYYFGVITACLGDVSLQQKFSAFPRCFILMYKKWFIHHDWFRVNHFVFTKNVVLVPGTGSFSGNPYQNQGARVRSFRWCVSRIYICMIHPCIRSNLGGKLENCWWIG